MKKLSLLILGLCSGLLSAQTADDIELFQLRNLHGTPRYTAMGGAFTALGNDFSAYSINPASAAVNRYSDLGFTLGFNNRNGNYSNFYGQNGSENNFDLNFENVGLNLILNPDDANRFSLAFSTTKLADFDRSFNLDGLNNTYTLGQYWAESSAGQHVDNISWDAYAAWQAYLLVSTNDTIDPDGYAYGQDDGNGNIIANSTLRYTFNQDGSFNETNIVMGLDQGGKVYYGLSFAFPTLSFRREEFITEYNLNTANPPYSANQYTYRRLNDIYANGFNMKFGFIYRPIPELRIGASYQSPSWYTVNQFYESDVEANFNQEPYSGVGTATQSDILETGQYAYRLRTPAIYRAGVASVIGKFLILSVDYYYQNQGNTQLYTNNNSFNISESLLQTDYQPGIDQLYRNGRQTISAGAEVRIKKIFLRGGYRYDESIYGDDYQDNTVGAMQSLSCGLGYKSGPWSFDLAWINSSRDRTYALYRGIDQSNQSFEVLQDLDMTEVSNNIVAGVTLKF
ncbi:hypothetical protein [Croceimicrobium hydrocarbonivorans]|uniref:Hemin receptor n=1 Tax=Croceimicrobium hydrocarbonivorans TaxID=2761580 RepID=A0A7H0VGX4_9FLAO|nr:hypothetical protein [Croceimicrobium hydrocarbonivorans]QNR24972.1 hypothetical protein H4K34_03775 [Croceimicrobium hydrocarbonivorans]